MWNFRTQFIDQYLQYFSLKLPSCSCQATSLMTSQHCYMQWLGAVRNKVITWASVGQDLHCQLASPGHNELSTSGKSIKSNDMTIHILRGCIDGTGSIVPCHNECSPSGEQPEHRILAHKLKQPTAGCIAIFRKYHCYTKHEGITTNSTLRNHWEYVTDVSKYHNAVIWSMIKTYYVLCSKTYSISSNVL